MEYSKVAAKWWAEQIRQSKHRKSEPENIKKFEEALAYAIEKRIEVCGYITLYTNYVPDYFLCSLSAKTYVSVYDFPSDVTMWVNESLVKVKYMNRLWVIYKASTS